MNKNKKLFKDSKRVKQRYATRKLKVGMVSLLMGFTFIFSAAAEPVVKIMPRFAVDASEIGQDRSGARFEDYQHTYLGTISPKTNRTYFNNPTKIHDFVQVEKIGKENKNFEQKWKITYNHYGLSKDGTPNFTNSPWFNFILSRDLKINSGIKVTMIPRIKYSTNPAFANGEKEASSYTYSVEDFDGRYDNDKDIKLSKSMNIFSTGFPSVEQIQELRKYDVNGKEDKTWYDRSAFKTGKHVEAGCYFGDPEYARRERLDCWYENIQNDTNNAISDEEHKAALDTMEYGGEVYRMKQHNDKMEGNQKLSMYYTTVEFTTKRDHKFYYEEAVKNPDKKELYQE